MSQLDPFGMMASFSVPYSNYFKRVLARQSPNAPEASISNWNGHLGAVSSPALSLVHHFTRQRGRNGTTLKQNALYSDNWAYINYFLQFPPYILKGLSTEECE